MLDVAAGGGRHTRYLNELGYRVVAVDVDASKLESLRKTPGIEVVEADLVLWATGRVPNTDGLGLEAVGVERRANGAVVVDAVSRTTVKSIFAIGDCTDRVALTPVAIAEAMALVETLNGNPIAMTYDAIPSAVFSQPPVGTVGQGRERRQLVGAQSHRLPQPPVAAEAGRVGQLGPRSRVAAVDLHVHRTGLRAAVRLGQAQVTLREVMALVRQVATTDMTVLLRGETIVRAGSFLGAPGTGRPVSRPAPGFAATHPPAAEVRFLE